MVEKFLRAYKKIEHTNHPTKDFEQALITHLSLLGHAFN